MQPHRHTHTCIRYTRPSTNVYTHTYSAHIYKYIYPIIHKHTQAYKSYTRRRQAASSCCSAVFGGRLRRRSAAAGGGNLPSCPWPLTSFQTSLPRSTFYILLYYTHTHVFIYVYNIIYYNTHAHAGPMAFVCAHCSCDAFYILL